ncbi:MAG: metal ABC transporter solute-binding protein, Zn/Mn family [Agromyces sp.]
MLVRARHSVRAFVVALVVTAALSGCAANGSSGSGSEIDVVASTNVWGDIASAIGGTHVRVTSLIDSATEDPHEYAASSTDLAAVAHAQVLLGNGNGYDDFFSQLSERADANAAIISANELTPRGDDNEHYWFDLDTVAAVAAALATTFSDQQPQHAADFADALGAFNVQLDELRGALAPTQTNATVLMAEPLPGYLFAAAGYTDLTPTALSRAVEAGSEIPTVALNDASTLLANGSVTVLALNEQNESAQTDQLRTAAESANVTVLTFSEVLPAGTSYLEWMRQYIGEVVAARG